MEMRIEAIAACLKCETEFEIQFKRGCYKMSDVRLCPKCGSLRQFRVLPDTAKLVRIDSVA